MPFIPSLGSNKIIGTFRYYRCLERYTGFNFTKIAELSDGDIGYE